MKTSNRRSLHHARPSVILIIVISTLFVDKVLAAHFKPHGSTTRKFPCYSDEWLLYNGSCYFVKKDELVGWATCRALCRAPDKPDGSDMVVIEDASENAFVCEQATDSTAWLGAHRIGEGSGAENFLWVDGQAMTYINFAPPHQPDNVGGIEDFVEMYPSSGPPGRPGGFWNDRPDNIGNLCICEYNPASSVTSTTSISTTVAVPSDQTTSQPEVTTTITPSSINTSPTPKSTAESTTSSSPELRTTLVALSSLITSPAPTSEAESSSLSATPATLSTYEFFTTVNQAESSSFSATPGTLSTHEFVETVIPSEGNTTQHERSTSTATEGWSVSATKSSSTTTRPSIRCPSKSVTVLGVIVVWPESEPGVVQLPCPTSQGRASGSHVSSMMSWTCSKFGRWVPSMPDMGNCQNLDIDWTQEQTSLASNESYVYSVVQNLTEILRGIHETMGTDNSTSPLGGDIINMVEFMRQAADFQQLELDAEIPPADHEFITRMFMEAVFKCGNEILKFPAESWTTLQGRRRTEALNSYQSTLEKTGVLRLSAMQSPGEEPLSIDGNSAYIVKRPIGPSIGDFAFNADDVSFTIPQSFIEHNLIFGPRKDESKANARVHVSAFFLAHAHLHKVLYNIQSPENSGEEIQDSDLDGLLDTVGPVVSKVVGASLYTGLGMQQQTSLRMHSSPEYPGWSTTSSKVMFRLGRIRSTIFDETRWTNASNREDGVSCSFWRTRYTKDFLPDGRPRSAWDETGCRVAETTSAWVECECDHLTNFAILLDVHGALAESPLADVLSFITISGCTLSIVCLILTTIAYSMPNLRGRKGAIHCFLCSTLAASQLLLLALLDRTADETACAIFAGLMHYSFLTSFAWMLVEGMEVYSSLAMVFRQKIPFKNLCIGAFTWPALIVGITGGASGGRAYGTGDYCWLNVSNGAIWAFGAPVIATVLINTALLVGSLCVARTAHRQSRRIRAAVSSDVNGRRDVNAKTWAWGALSLSFLLGLTWILGFLSFNEDTQVFAIFFALVNSCQGVFIFVFHVILNPKTRKEVSACLVRKRSETRSARWSATTSAKKTGQSSRLTRVTWEDRARRASRSRAKAKGPESNGQGHVSSATSKERIIST